MCISLLTEVESCEESDLTLIHLADQGGLKYPSRDIISAVTIQWQILVILEQNPALFSHFISESDKSILIQLAMSRIEFVGFEFWRDKCPDCQRPFASYLAQILSATTNCLLKNMIRNLNSERNWIIILKDQRKTTKVAVRVISNSVILLVILVNLCKQGCVM